MSWYEQQPEYKQKIAELEKQAKNKRKKAKQKKIMEAMQTKEVLVTSETQIKLEKQISEAFVQLENLNHSILEKKEILKGLEIDYINAVGKLQDIETKIKSNVEWCKILDKLDQLKKLKKSQSQHTGV
jgi:transposase